MREKSSEHWYARDGSCAYTVIGANGKERPTTIRDARKLGLVPSVSGIIQCAASPELEYWKQNQVMLATITLPKHPDETEEFWIKRIWIDSREHARKAAERGTAIHAAVERFLLNGSGDSEYWGHVEGALNTLSANSVDFENLNVEQSFYHQIGFGGKSDLVCYVPDGLVIDMKTKEFDDPDKLKTYENHHMQLAAYREGLKLPQAKCAILYISVTVPGLAKLIWIDSKDLLRGWSMFQSLLKYWQAKNKYYPAMEVAA